MIRAVVFDLDDTLISEYEYIQSGYRHISKVISKKINKSKDEIFNDLLSILKIDSKNVFNQLLDKYKIEYDAYDIKELVNEYRIHFPTIKLFADVHPTIKKLKEENIKIGLITDGYSVAQKNKIISLEIEHLFDYLIVTDDYGRDFWKPSPKSFELMQKKLAVNFDEMIYVGDNPEKDFYIQSLYPIYTVRISRPSSVYKDAQYLSGLQEHFAINSLEELLEFIIEIGEKNND